MSSDKARIVVVGSINMDLVVRATHFPTPGETVLGEQLVTTPGGKGANQAVAVARMGGRCAMVGRVGMDEFGSTLVAGLKAEGIDCTHVLDTEDASTGVAMIVVDAKGENSIVVAGGANRLLTPDDLFACSGVFADASVMVVQMELPLQTVHAAVQLARRSGCKIILDPAPPTKAMCPELYQVDIIAPNAQEAEVLTGQLAIEERVDKSVAMELLARGAGAAVLKLGPRGALVVTKDGLIERVPAYKVQVVDTTGAGDAFVGALAVAAAEEIDLVSAVKLANATGALACTRSGAQAAMPRRDAVVRFMHEQSV